MQSLGSNQLNTVDSEMSPEQQNFIPNKYDINPVVSQRMRMYFEENKESIENGEESDNQIVSQRQLAAVNHNNNLFEKDDDNLLLIHDSEQDIQNMNNLRAFTLNAIQSAARDKNSSAARPVPYEIYSSN